MVNPGPALEMATATHPGRVRSHNEDAIAVDRETGLAVLADGMGGYNAGEVASSMAVALVSSRIPQALREMRPAGLREEPVERLIAAEMVRTNAAVYAASRRNPEYSGMGTTLVVALWYDSRVTVGHVGDSRLYRLRGEALEQMTRDHSVVQEQIDRGLITREQARWSPERNLVTRAVGIEPEVEPEVHTYFVQPEDIYLLCSDGLSEMLEDEEIRLTLVSLKANLPLAADRLVQQANDNGGRDNISIILVRTLQGSAAARA
jgi:protein phosphatase